MRLNFQTSNLLHQVLSKDINIFYRESHSFFDHILYELDCNFFIMNYKNQKGIHIKADNIDLYSYDLFIGTGILNKHKDNLNTLLQTNSLIFEHNPKNILIKKEDAAILQSALSKYDIVVFAANDLNFQKKHDIKYGIPLDIFNEEQNKKNNTILIRHNNENLYKHLEHQLSEQYICKEINLDCSIEELNSKLGDCKLFIELTDQYINVLCASAKGCKCIAPAKFNQDELQGVFYFSNIDEILQIAKSNIDKDINVLQNREYIGNKYNYEKFQKSIFNLVHKLSKKEALLL